MKDLHIRRNRKKIIIFEMYRGRGMALGLAYVRGEDTYNPDDVNISRYVILRGFVIKI